MADSSESLLLFEASALDINENMANSQNCSYSSDQPLKDTASSIICPGSDSSFSKCTETTGDCIKTSELCSEIPFNDFDAIPTNSDEFDSYRKADSGIHDSENNIVGSVKLIEFDSIERNLSDSCDAIISDFNREENDTEFKDEEFHDAVQFFKDPLSLIFLEKAGTSSAPSEPSMARSSLYQKFDPLHAKFFSQGCIKSNELKEISEDDVEPEYDNLGSACLSDNPQSEVETDKPKRNTTPILIEAASDGLQSNIFRDIHSNMNNSIPDIVNKHLSNISPRQSIGNILISFDSPVFNKETDSCVGNKIESDLPKIYTEEELQRTLKIQELTIQETFLKKQQELEESFLKRQQELETKAGQHKCLSNSAYIILKEVVDLVYVLYDKEKQLTEKLQIAENENNKLKEDLKTSVEDIQSVENTFSDFHKRYEQCKNMLKVYTENEKSLKQQIENINMQLHEKEEMYKALQCRTEEIIDKANSEVVNAKKTGDAQVAVLKAQLKKAELKISSLESDVKHVKIENGKLSSICDELMAKVSET